MEKLLELGDILLYPSEFNAGEINRGRYNFGAYDDFDNTASLPIFTTNESIVSKENWESFNKVGIRPVLPITEDLNIRLEGCQYIFASFTINEIKTNFLTNVRTSRNIFRICIENNGNGQDTEIFNVASSLRKAYGNQVNIMAGNMGNPQTYVSYCKAGINYVRVGISECMPFDQETCGFYYPLASLLIDTLGVRKTTCMGLRQTKIIAEGEIETPTDILKAIALGADYVMITHEFAHLIDSAGTVYSKTKTDVIDKMEEVSSKNLIDVPIADLKDMELKRLYSPSEKASGRSSWVKVNNNLANWTKQMYEIFNFGFDMTGSLNWKEYKEKVKFGRVQ